MTKETVPPIRTFGRGMARGAAGNLPTYRSCREYLTQLFHPTIDALTRAQEMPY